MTRMSGVSRCLIIHANKTIVRFHAIAPSFRDGLFMARRNDPSPEYLQLLRSPLDRIRVNDNKDNCIQVEPVSDHWSITGLDSTELADVQTSL